MSIGPNGHDEVFRDGQGQANRSFRQRIAEPSSDLSITLIEPRKKGKDEQSLLAVRDERPDAGGTAHITAIVDTVNSRPFPDWP